MAYFGVDTQVRIEEITLQFQAIIRQKKGNGLHQMRKVFKAHDFNGNGKLDLSEFEEALAEFGLFPKIVDLKALHQFYDLDKDGQISYAELINQLADSKMSARKVAMVEKLWTKLDPNGAGEITGKVLSESLVNKTAVQPTMEAFEGTANGDLEGKVSIDEFLQTHREISMIIPNDESFVKLLSDNWGVSEQSDSSVKMDSVMQIIKLMRQRLLTISNNGQEEYVLRNMFRTFDRDDTGKITLNELAGMLANLQVLVQEKELLAVMREMDKNQSGGIEFEEFCEFMIINPYK